MESASDFIDDRVVTRIAFVAQPGLGGGVGEHVTWNARKVVFIARAGFRRILCSVRSCPTASCRSKDQQSDP